MRNVLVIVVLLVLSGAGAVYVSARGEAPVGDQAAQLLSDARERVAAAAASAGAGSEAQPDDASGSLAGWFAKADEAAERSGKQVYYQFVDDAGSVRFVQSLDQVPAHLRDHAGRIEMDQRGAPAPDRAAAARARAQPAAPARAAAPSVVVYTTSWCGWCRKTLAWLDQQGIDYVNKDIERDPDHREELIRKSGRTSIPVVEIDGELIRGYDPGRMGQLLRASS